MKVLQINSVAGRGSTGRIVYDLAKAIEANGGQCLVGYGRGTAPSDLKAVRIGNDFDVYWHVVMTRLFDAHGFASKRATKSFLREVEKFEPDVIHLHNIHGYYINIKLLFDWLRESNKRVIWTLHDCWAFTGHCAYFTYAMCEKWRTACEGCPQKSKYPKSIFLDGSKRNYLKKKEIFTSLEKLTIVTPSQWLADIVKQSFLAKYEVKVIRNGIDTNIFYPRDRMIFRKKYGLEDKFIILGVANVWDERKGLKYFLALSRIVDSDTVIVLVGLNKKQLRNLPKNIIGITRTNNVDELAEIYSAADVFFNPTLEDNFPTVNLEAQACGTPVVAFDSGGTRETVLNSGVVIERGNIEKAFKNIQNYIAIKQRVKIDVEMVSKITMIKKYLQDLEEGTKRANNTR